MLVSHPQETRMTPPFEPGGPWNVIEFPRSAIRYRTSPPPPSPRRASLSFQSVAWLLLAAASILALGVLANAWWTVQRISEHVQRMEDAFSMPAAARPARTGGSCASPAGETQAWQPTRTFPSTLAARFSGGEREHTYTAPERRRGLRSARRAFEASRRARSPIDQLGAGDGRGGPGPMPSPAARHEAERRFRRAPQCASRTRVRSLRLSLAPRPFRDGAHLRAGRPQQLAVPRRQLRHAVRERALPVVVRGLLGLELRAKLGHLPVHFVDPGVHAGARLLRDVARGEACLDGGEPRGECADPPADPPHARPVPAHLGAECAHLPAHLQQRTRGLADLGDHIGIAHHEVLVPIAEPELRLGRTPLVAEPGRAGGVDPETAVAVEEPPGEAGSVGTPVVREHGTLAAGEDQVRDRGGGDRARSA